MEITGYLHAGYPASRNSGVQYTSQARAGIHGG